MLQTTKKRFDSWNNIKKNIDTTVNYKHFHERDVLFVYMRENVGFEQSGKGEDFLRPVLVYKKFANNLFLGIPLTTTHKNKKFYETFELKGKHSTAILSQIRLFDAKRIKYLYAKIGTGSFRRIKKKLIELIQ